MRLASQRAPLAGDLQRRLVQHFVNRDSSVVTGTSAAGLNIDYVAQVEWWEHPDFADADVRHAAELVAFDVFEPALRSRGNPRHAAWEHYENRTFTAEMGELFKRAPHGKLILPRLPDIAQRVADLEARVNTLEVLLDGRRGSGE